jgi:hypothetical protein
MLTIQGNPVMLATDAGLFSRAARDFGNFVSHSGEEMLDVQWVYLLSCGARFVPMPAQGLELLNEVWVWIQVFIHLRRRSLKRSLSCVGL